MLYFRDRPVRLLKSPQSPCRPSSRSKNVRRLYIEMGNDCRHSGMGRRLCFSRIRLSLRRGLPSAFVRHDLGFSS